MKTRRTWSDQDKEALIRQAASYQGLHKEFYAKMGISGAWFRDMREKFLKAHPEIDLTVPVVKMASGWPADPEERKREMLRRQAKARLNKSSGLKPKPKPKASPGSAVLDPAVASALAAYRELPKLEKAPWRKAHRLTGSQITKINLGIAGPGVVARVLSFNGNRDQRLARIPDPISLIPDSAPQPAGVPVTLDDAILAFEVKQDHMREFIDQLKRMRSGR
jgi:hypothetical protein